jgi:hypothetical protein
MVKVVVELLAFAKVTPSVLVHLSNTLPVAGGFAVMVTVSPSAGVGVVVVPLITVRA